MRTLRRLLLFASLLGFWLLLSGQLDPLFVGIGAVIAALITSASTRLLERTIGSAAEHPRVRVLRLAQYIGWLLGRMAVSALQVAWIVINPRVPPEPGIVRIRNHLTSPAARATLANSITLVPGTMTLEIDADEITVHTFTPDAVEDLATASMQNRVARVFSDQHQDPPELIWEAGHTPDTVPDALRHRSGENGTTGGEADS